MDSIHDIKGNMIHLIHAVLLLEVADEFINVLKDDSEISLLGKDDKSSIKP